MVVTTRSQLTSPAAIQIPSSSSDISQPFWRCNNRHRLHRGDTSCTASSPPSSPIVDTPEKRKTFERKRNTCQLQDSFATTDRSSSRAAGCPHPQARALAAVREEHRELARSNHDEGFQVTAAASSSRSSPDRIPESSVNLPSSPPLPLRQLNADNLSLLEGRSSSPQAKAHSEASSARSLPAYALHQISRLVLRSRINALHHDAAQVRLAAAHEELGVLREITRHSAIRSKTWEALFFMLALFCLAYTVWCFINSAEFEFINSCRRACYGL